MRYKLINKIIEPCLHLRDRIIIDANKEFIDFTGFTLAEIMGKSIVQIGDILKINLQMPLNSVSTKQSVYIFTKSLSAREVIISLCQDKDANREVYTFTEKRNSRLEDKLGFVEQTFIDNIAGVAIYSIPDLILLKANQKYLDFMEAPYNKEQDSIGKSITEIVTGYKGSKAEVIWNNVIKNQRTSYVKEFETDVFARGITYWESFLTPIFENKKMRYIFETSIDVTEKVLKNKNIEQQDKIIEQQKPLEAIIENISDGISVFNNKGEYILFNKAARNVSPLLCEKTYNVGDRNNQCELYSIDGEKIAPEDIPARRVMRGENFKNMRISLRFPHKTMQIDVSGTPIYDSKGEFTLGVLCSRDMTVYFNQVEAMRNRYGLLGKMIDTFDLPVVRLSCPDLKIISINQKAFGIAKSLCPDIISISQLKDNKLGDLADIFKLLRTSKSYQYINEVISQRKTKYLNKKTLLINGNEVYWNIIFEPILEADGQVKGILILIIDVTPEINSNILMKKALKSQGDFLTNISHELKTPLNVISAAVQLLTLYCNNGSLDDRKDSIIKYMESIKLNTFRLSKLINNIVDTSKIDAGFFQLNLSNNNIVELVEEIVISLTNFTESKGLNIIFDTNIEEKIIACDPDIVERVVLNLISNAIKFSEVGNEIFVQVKDRNKFIEISVKDHGIGIESKNLDMIFDRFSQVDNSLSRNVEGTGIGLSLVKSIVELHGGTINVESEFGKGSKFIVKLPSGEISHENIYFNGEMRDKHRNIQVELSDINS